jgi:parallel beta-helix repeat protein
MRNTCCLRLVTLSALLFLCSITSSAENHSDYVITVSNEQLHFVAQPEAGYVLKTRDDIESMDSTSWFLKSAEDVKISPIRGLGRKGTYIVYNERSAVENDRTIKSLKVYSEVQYAAPLFSSNGETVAVIPEIVIRVKPNTPVEQLEMICAKVGCTIIKPMEFTEQEYLLEVLGPDAEAVFVAVEELGQAPCVEWACPNTASQLKLCSQSMSDRATSGGRLEDDGSGQDANSVGVFPNDEYFPLQWHLHNTGQSGGTPGADIRATEAWEITTGDPNIVVAIIGTGVDTHHPDLVNNLVPGYDFLDDDDLPDPANDDRLDAHDTLCAGLVAAEGNNRIGIAGVTWNCKIMPIRVGSATSWLRGSVIATAFRWAAAHGADILSNSWIGGTSPWPIFLSGVVDITQPNGIGRGGNGCVVVFCAGNDEGVVPYPAKYPEVITVGATDNDDVRWHYSGYGPELDLMAPSGCDGEWCGEMATFWSTDQTGYGGYSVLNSDLSIQDYSEYFGGTSASCPIVAGVAALILSADPNLTNLEVQRILYRSAQDLGEPGWDQYYGWGRVDARAAVEMALNPPSPLLYVDDNAPNDPGPNDPNISDPNENCSAEHPFDAIQEAINYAAPGETLIVLPGIYTGIGNRDIDLKGKAITVCGKDGPSTCVIDCQNASRGFVFHSGESSLSILEGLTIINGNGERGGGIYFTDNSSPTIRNCILTNNTASFYGGAIAVENSSPTITNCTFSSNSAAFVGGCLSCTSGNPTLTNCILWGNTPGEIYVIGGTPTVTYSDIQGGFTGEGNIDTDPLFADADNDDYHLMTQVGRWDPNSGSWVVDDVTSPCIDAGDPNSDWSSETWPNGERINMGAYGGTRQASMSIQPQVMSLPRIAYIYDSDAEAAKSFLSLLVSYGCATTLIALDQAPAAALEDYDLVIVGDDTEDAAAWNDPQVADAIEGAGRPIVGMGEGGYDFFGVLGLSIGRPNGMHGDGDSIIVIDPNYPLFVLPYAIEIPENRVLRLYTQSNNATIHLQMVHENVTVLGDEPANPGYSSLILEQNRYLFWGFTESPQKMTEVGKKLFINVVIRTANKAWESEN